MADYESVLKRLYAILGAYITEPGLNPDSELVAEYGMSSLQIMEMVADIEDDFDISVPLNLLPNIVTVRDLAQAVTALLD